MGFLVNSERIFFLLTRMSIKYSFFYPSPYLLFDKNIFHGFFFYLFSLLFHSLYSIVLFSLLSLFEFFPPSCVFSIFSHPLSFLWLSLFRFLSIFDPFFLCDFILPPPTPLLISSFLVFRFFFQQSMTKD